MIETGFQRPFIARQAMYAVTFTGLQDDSTGKGTGHTKPDTIEVQSLDPTG